ncbi:hypothetical protein EG329_005253 [Mollisiaceae sp. DMI_Dod_QoI]|nr:hypothetical protein EG329_005253 [Helotiales sp. DMI_Dod_QoI]
MHYQSAFIALLAAVTVTAVPLNINLGAYSPALVVGDGEISFGGAESAEALVNTLAGASAGTEAAANGGVTRAGTTEGSTIITPAEVATEATTPSASPSPSTLPSGAFGIGKKVVEPREPELADTGVAKEKRDLAGFNAALNFATGALNKGPTVELGTGEGGSGVGITVKPGVVAKRDEGSLPTVTLLKIRSLGNNDVARKARRAQNVVPREVNVDDIDSINLNLDGDVEFTIAEVKP